MTWTLQWILWNWHLFLLFLKENQEAWHSYFREKFECNTETSVIWQHSCLSLEGPYSRSDCTTYPLSFSRWFQLMLTGVLSFRICSYFVIFDDCGFIIPLSVLSRLCALSPSLSKKLVTPEFLQDRQSFPFRPAHIRRHGARTVTVKRGRADRDNFPNVASILKKAGPNKLQNQTNARTTSPNLK